MFHLPFWERSLSWFGEWSSCNLDPHADEVTGLSQRRVIRCCGCLTHKIWLLHAWRWEQERNWLGISAAVLKSWHLRPLPFDESCLFLFEVNGFHYPPQSICLLCQGPKCSNFRQSVLYRWGVGQLSLVPKSWGLIPPCSELQTTPQLGVLDGPTSESC